LKRVLLIDDASREEAYPSEPLVRRAAEAFCLHAVNGSTGRTAASADVPRGKPPRSADPIYGYVTENRQAWSHRWGTFYSSCGDLCHSMLWHLGVWTPDVNQDRNDRLPLLRPRHPEGFRRWRVGANVSMLESMPGVRAAEPGDRYQTGDMLRVGETNATVHVLVVLDHNGGDITTADYGQPGGALKTRKFRVQLGRPRLGARVIARHMPLWRIVTAAADSGALGEATLPDSFVGGLDLDATPDTDPAPPPEMRS